MLYVQNFNCSFVSVIGEVKSIQKVTLSNLEDNWKMPQKCLNFEIDTEIER